MLEEFAGLPLHPLVVHAAVVFVPLQIVAAFTYAAISRIRGLIAWAVVGLSVVGPVAAIAAKLSGEAFRSRLVKNNMIGTEILGKVDQHASYANGMVTGSLVLAALTAVVVIQRRGSDPKPTDPGSSTSTGDGRSTRASVVVVVATVGILAAGVAAGYFTFRAGDSGATMVWSGM